MPNLIEVYVNVDSPDNKILIRSITSVKCLAICLEVTYDESVVVNQLEHLELCTCIDHSSGLLVRLLKDSPNLQGLELFVINDHNHNDRVHWYQPTTVPECILSSLQTLNWSAYTGQPEERDLVVYLLQNDVHLKTARIKSFESDDRNFEMIKELALSSRASRTCQFIFD